MSTVSHLRSLKLEGCLCHSSLSGVTPDAVIVERKHGLRGFTAGRAGRFPFPTFQVCCPHHWSLLPGWTHVKTRKGYVLGVFAPLRACAYPETMYATIIPYMHSGTLPSRSANATPTYSQKEHRKNIKVKIERDGKGQKIIIKTK